MISTIHQQDDHELFLHIETSWHSIMATLKELDKRNKKVMFYEDFGDGDISVVTPHLCKWRMR